MLDVALLQVLTLGRITQGHNLAGNKHIKTKMNSDHYFVYEFSKWLTIRLNNFVT